MNKKLKSQKIFRIDHIPGSVLPDVEHYGILQSQEEYDENGNLTLEIGYTRDGEVADKSSYQYNNDGMLVESLIFGEDDEILERNEIFRDKDSRLVREVVHYLDGSADIRTFFYDSAGNLTGMEVKDDEDEPDYSENYYYLEGKLVRTERFDEEGEIIFYQEDTIDDGRMVQRKIWSSEDEEPYTLITEYNERGNREQETRFDRNDKIMERNTWEENEQGLIVRIVEENRLKKNTTEITYDESGRVIHQKETDLHGQLNHEVFRSYDEDGLLHIVTAEITNKNTGDKRAYSLVHRYEFYDR